MRLTFASLATLALLAGCSKSDTPMEGNPYSATIRRTSYGIPHIHAADMGSLGFGVGYASAEDYICILADEIVKVRSERSSYFGPGASNANVDGDLAYLGLGLRARATAALPGLPADVLAAITGYVAGYNKLLATKGNAALPAPCTGAAWVKPISVTDLFSYYLDLGLRESADPLLGYIANAAPPGAPGAHSQSTHLPSFKQHVAGLGSNGWAIGKDRSADGTGMLVANPHFPWEGDLKLYEMHLTVPGQLDVYGASLLGVVPILIGFNADVAWTHTVSYASHFTAYALTLTSGDPTSYQYDGQTRKMTSTDVSIQVLQPDGTMQTVSRTYYRSHYGPMVNGLGLSWGTTNAYTYRDANENDTGLAEQWLRTDQATSVAGVQQVSASVHGVPWVNTMTADKTGNALMMDSSRVPNLSPATVTAYQAALASNATTRLLAQNGVVLLDGSTSRDEWVTTDESDGLVPVSGAPQLARTDFVMNSNDAPWLANPAQPLTDFPLLYGSPSTPPSPRTRTNLVLLTEKKAGGASGASGLFTVPLLEAAILSNRAAVEQELHAAVVTRCQAAGTTPVMGVDLTPACSALAGWDGLFDTASTGALVWREFLATFSYADQTDAGTLYAVPFDPAQPLTTPSGLAPAPATGTDPILAALATALTMLQQAGVAPATPLGQAQFSMKGNLVIPIHGGDTSDGTANVTIYEANSNKDTSFNTTLLPGPMEKTMINPTTHLAMGGYLVNFGSSFVMAMEFAPSGPQAEAMLTYSESSDPSSPHYSDQTQLFSKKGWRPILFTDAQIAADPNLVTTRITGAR